MIQDPFKVGFETRQLRERFSWTKTIKNPLYIYFLVWHNIRQMQSLEEEFEQLVKKHSQERQNPNYLEEVTEGKEPALVH